jgi:HSP20 family protein
MFTLTPFASKTPDVFDYFNALDRFLDQETTPAFTQCRADVQETDDAFLLAAELPGFDKENIHIDVKDSTLTITANRKEETVNDNSAPTAENENATDTVVTSSETPSANSTYLRREIRTCNYKRSFHVDGVDVNNIKANYVNGILNVTLPKLVPQEPESVQIHVN